MDNNYDLIVDEMESLHQVARKIISDLNGQTQLCVVTGRSHAQQALGENANMTLYGAKVSKDAIKNDPVDGDWLFLLAGLDFESGHLPLVDRMLRKANGNLPLVKRVLRETNGDVRPVSATELGRIIEAVEENLATTDACLKMVLRITPDPNTGKEIVNTIPVSWYHLAITYPQLSEEELADTFLRLGRQLRNPTKMSGVITGDLRENLPMEQMSEMGDLAKHYPVLKKLYYYSQKFPGDAQDETGMVFVFDKDTPLDIRGVVQLDLVVRLYDRGLIEGDFGGRAELGDTPANIEEMELIARPIYDRDLHLTFGI